MRQWKLNSKIITIHLLARSLARCICAVRNCVSADDLLARYQIWQRQQAQRSFLQISHTSNELFRSELIEETTEEEGRRRKATGAAGRGAARCSHACGCVRVCVCGRGTPTETGGWTDGRTRRTSPGFLEVAKPAHSKSTSARMDGGHSKSFSQLRTFHWTSSAPSAAPARPPGARPRPRSAPPWFGPGAAAAAGCYS